MTQDRKHEIPIHSVKGFVSIGTQEHTGDSVMISQMDQIQTFGSVVSGFSCQNKAHLVKMNQLG